MIIIHYLYIKKIDVKQTMKMKVRVWFGGGIRPRQENIAEDIKNPDLPAIATCHHSWSTEKKNEHEYSDGIR